MKFVLAGCTGFIGEAFIKTIINQNHEIIVLTRQPTKIPNSIASCVTTLYWNGRTYDDEWAQHLQGSDVVINLTGAPIFRLWTKGYKKKLWNSRVLSTGLLIDAMKQYGAKPKVFINASAMGYFQNLKNSHSNPFNEMSRKGQGFLSDLCAAWEKEARKAENLGVRVVIPRISIVLGKEGGAFPLMIKPFKFNVGHILGEGDQAQPWIHIDDMVSILHFAITNTEVSGIIHAVAPEKPLSSHAHFSEVLAQLMGKKIWFKFPERLFTLLSREFGESMLQTPYFCSTVLQSLGFSYKYNTLKKMLKDLV